jgi:hypothetical protein
MIDGKKHSLTEALEGQQAAGPAGSGGPDPAGSPRAGDTPQEVAEETRRQQEARSHGRPHLDDHLVTVGRGQQTHG